MPLPSSMSGLLKLVIPEKKNLSADPDALAQTKLEEKGTVSEPAPKKLRKVRLKELIRKTGKMTMSLDRSLLKEAAEKAMGQEEEIVISPTASAGELVAQSLALVQNKKPREALKIAEVAEERGLTNNEARDLWTEIGNLCYDQSFMSLSAKAFRKAHERDTESMATSFNLGVALHCLGDMDEAERLYAKSASFDSSHPKLCCNYGVIHFQKDRFDQSEHWIKKALDGAPDYVRAWDNLACAYGAQERFDEAMEACEKAIEFNDDCLEAWFKLGLIRFGMESYASAKVAFLKAEALEVCRAYSYYHLGMIACQEWNEEEAEKYMRDACALDRMCSEGPVAWAELGDLYKVQGKTTKSDAAYKVAADLEKNFEQSVGEAVVKSAADFGIKV